MKIFPQFFHRIKYIVLSIAHVNSTAKSWTQAIHCSHHIWHGVKRKNCAIGRYNRELKNVEILWCSFMKWKSIKHMERGVSLKKHIELRQKDSAHILSHVLCVHSIVGLSNNWGTNKRKSTEKRQVLFFEVIKRKLTSHYSLEIFTGCTEPKKTDEPSRIRTEKVC